MGYYKINECTDMIVLKFKKKIVIDTHISVVNLCL